MGLGNDITTHQQDSIDLLITQYKGKQNAEDWAGIWGSQIQELEDVYCDMADKRNLDNAFGALLDLMGTIVVQDRQGFDDTFYQALLKAKVAENTSQGDIDSVVNATALLTGASLVHLQEWPAAAFGLYIDTQIDASLINFFYERLNRVDSAGVRLEALICFDPDEAFAFEGGPGNAAGFGDSTNAATGGVLAGLHVRTEPAFAFAAGAGVDDGDAGFGSALDNLVGGILQGT